MQRHQCGVAEAQLEIAFQAFKLGLPVGEVAALLVATTAGEQLTGQQLVQSEELLLSMAMGPRTASQQGQPAAGLPALTHIDSIPVSSRYPVTSATTEIVAMRPLNVTLSLIDSDAPGGEPPCLGGGPTSGGRQSHRLRRRLV